jgi:predicted RNA-binding protein with RPS1 domain
VAALFPSLWISTQQLVADDSAEESRPLCFYRSRSTGKWKERIELKDVRVGDELVDCYVVQELLEAKTGPKVFCDCGVGRFVSSNSTKNWRIVNAMLRLDRKGSVARKRAARLRSKKCFTGYVSRIRLDNQQFEISLSPEVVRGDVPGMISASKLAVGQEVVGKVVRIEPFGVFVDVGANRLGLLHIRMVADLYGHYIDKSRGLVAAGLERGSGVRLQVASNDGQRLFLDFTEDVKVEASKSRPRNANQVESTGAASGRESVHRKIPEVEAAKYVYTSVPSAGTFMLANTGSDDEAPTDDDDDYDEYDEDRDIEDALGLGTY